MSCSKCGNPGDAGESFCRRCGTDLENAALVPLVEGFLKETDVGERFVKASSKDPDELTGNGIGSVIAGDGFFMVAIMLSATHSSISSTLWLLLLIPAFFFFGKGFADLFHARQIQRRLRQSELAAGPVTAALPPAQTSVIDIFKTYTSGQLTTTPGVTERTTRELQ